MFGRIPYNFYRADTNLPIRYVGLSLRENKNAMITRIVYMPYSNDNAVRRGDTYELLYWNNDWISLGTSKANGANYVLFPKVPKNALLLLRNTKGGVQHEYLCFEIKGKSSGSL
jgi:hypothetical protein